MKTETKKRNKVSLAIYIGAAIFAAYAIFALINTSLYIGNLVSTQYITVSDSLTDIITYFATNCFAYLFYAAALGGLGYLIDACVPKKTVVKDTVTTTETLASIPETQASESETPASTSETLASAQETLESTSETPASEPETLVSVSETPVSEPETDDLSGKRL